MRNLNMFLGMEVVNGRINGSASDVEKNTSGYKNISFTKKIGNRSKISGQNIKFNLNEYMEKVLSMETISKSKEGKQVKYDIDPMRFMQQDIFGFMLAEKIVISQEEFDKLDEAEKTLWKKEGKKGYSKNITKKRIARLQLNALVNVGYGRVEKEWNVCASDGDSMPYVSEVYSGVHTTIANLDIENLGKFTISNSESQFRDYDEAEAKVKDVRDLTNEERLERVNAVLEAIEHLSIKSNQTNYLTDTTPKFVILGDYSWGNNAFGNAIINKDGINIEALKEAIEQNEDFRLGNIYIGVNNFFDDKYNTMKEELEEEFKDCDFIKVTNVHEAFKGYKEELKNSLM